MKRVIAKWVLALSFVTLPMSAQSGEECLAEDPPAITPDYSSSAMRQLFVDGGDDRRARKSPFDFGYTLYSNKHIRLRWLPLVMPLILSRTSGSLYVQPFPMPDPLVMTKTEIAGTPRQMRDRFRDWRERRTLLKNVSKRNAKDNQH